MYRPDGVEAEYGGEAIPVAFPTSSFAGALFNQPLHDGDARFVGIVLPKKCKTFVKVD